MVYDKSSVCDNVSLEKFSLTSENKGTAFLESQEENQEKV